MNDLISRNALLAKMKRTSRYFDVKFDIEEMPAVDAVEVVRCKDCDQWDGSECSIWYGFHENDFCSYGERRDINGHDSQCPG